MGYVVISAHFLAAAPGLCALPALGLPAPLRTAQGDCLSNSFGLSHLRLYLESKITALRLHYLLKCF